MKHTAQSLLGIALSLLMGALMIVAGSQQGVEWRGIPVFALCGGAAFAIQWLAFLPAWLYRTEKYYDLTGSLTYITLALLGLGLASGGQAAGSAASVIAALVVVWAMRLGSFLFRRILAEGRDGRFDRIKTQGLRFLMAWTLQGLWVLVTFSAGLAAITSTPGRAADGWLSAGAVLWVLGFLVEVIADGQKRRFRQLPGNADRFIQSGLWRWSRHPNYCGEIILWTGIAVAAVPSLSGWQHLTLISPLFVYLLLTRVSGVNLLEARARGRWGDDPEYLAYLRHTPVLFPLPGARRARGSG